MNLNLKYRYIPTFKYKNRRNTRISTIDIFVQVFFITIITVNGHTSHISLITDN